MKFQWSHNITCPKKCDDCILFEVDDKATRHIDIMCLKKSHGSCIWQGNLIEDGSFVAVTSSKFDESACFADAACPPCDLGNLEVCMLIFVQVLH